MPDAVYPHYNMVFPFPVFEETYSCLTVVCLRMVYRWPLCRVVKHSYGLLLVYLPSFGGFVLPRDSSHTLHIDIVDQSRLLGHGLFRAAGDWGPWLYRVLHAGVVSLPFHAGQCGLEGAGDIGCEIA